MILTDGHRTVIGTFVRESALRIWMRVRGQLHGFAKPKWRETDESPW